MLKKHAGTMETYIYIYYIYMYILETYNEMIMGIRNEMMMHDVLMKRDGSKPMKLNQIIGEHS